MPDYYAVKSAVWRKAGTVQKRCLVIQLLGTSFGDADSFRKLCIPGQKVIAHVGLSKKGQWVFLWKKSLWIRYPRHELTGKETLWKRNAKEREKLKAYYHNHPKPTPRSLSGNLVGGRSDDRIAGAVHLWSGDAPWGKNGKFALKPFKGELRKGKPK